MKRLNVNSVIFANSRINNI